MELNENTPENESQTKKHEVGAEADENEGEIMCWKDPTKVCRCDSPKAGVYCGRFPLPTD